MLRALPAPLPCAAGLPVAAPPALCSEPLRALPPHSESANQVPKDANSPGALGGGAGAGLGAPSPAREGAHTGPGGRRRECPAGLLGLLSRRERSAPVPQTAPGGQGAPRSPPGRPHSAPARGGGAAGKPRPGGLRGQHAGLCLAPGGGQRGRARDPRGLRPAARAQRQGRTARRQRRRARPPRNAAFLPSCAGGGPREAREGAQLAVPARATRRAQPPPPPSPGDAHKERAATSTPLPPGRSRGRGQRAPP